MVLLTKHGCKLDGVVNIGASQLAAVGSPARSMQLPVAAMAGAADRR